MPKKAGRPVKWTPDRIKQLKDDLTSYLYDKDMDGEYKNVVPSVSAFAFEHGISRQRLYEFEELKELIALCHTKKEADLERGMLSGGIPPAAAIFSLKQLGWTDRQDVNEHHDGGIKLEIEYV